MFRRIWATKYSISLKTNNTFQSSSKQTNSIITRTLHPQNKAEQLSASWFWNSTSITLSPTTMSSIQNYGFMGNAYAHLLFLRRWCQNLFNTTRKLEDSTAHYNKLVLLMFDTSRKQQYWKSNFIIASMPMMPLPAPSKELCASIRLSAWVFAFVAAFNGTSALCKGVQNVDNGRCSRSLHRSLHNSRSRALSILSYIMEIPCPSQGWRLLFKTRRWLP